MDFQALKHDIGLTFNHLDSLTVGEYVARNIVIDIAYIIADKVDIKKLNNTIRKFAVEGRNMAKTLKKCAEFDCSKDVSKGVSLVCIYCQNLTHKNCITSPVIDIAVNYS